MQFSPGSRKHSTRVEFLAPRLNRDELCASIVAPARLCNGDVAPELVNVLLNDTGPASDQLPLLQHCLMRMWSFAHRQSEAQQDGQWTLTMGHYLDKRVDTLKNAFRTTLTAFTMNSSDLFQL